MDEVKRICLYPGAEEPGAERDEPGDTDADAEEEGCQDALRAERMLIVHFGGRCRAYENRSSEAGEKDARLGASRAQDCFEPGGPL